MNSEKTEETTTEATEKSPEKSPEESPKDAAPEATETKPVLNHIYYEIESDLLAKPNTLADICVTDPQPTVVYCNQPSEADLIEVVMNKRQVSCRKLIGRVPKNKVESAAKQVIAGEIALLIVTDISARELDANKFKRIVNYSIHEDPEIYIHRTEVLSAKCVTETVVNLVSPLDHSSFHYLKKVVDFEINETDLPKSEDVEQAKFALLVKEAQDAEYTNEEEVDSLLTKIKAAPEADTILKFFVHNSMNVLPELKAKSSGNRSHKKDKNLDSFKDMEARIISRNIPKIEYIRFYVGSNNESDLEEEKVYKLVSDVANLPKEQVHSYNNRGAYAFLDVLKEHANDLTDLLDAYHMESGEDLIFKKAANIVVNAEDPAKVAAKAAA